MGREASENPALVDGQPLRLAVPLEGARKLLIGAEHERQQKIVERMRVAGLDEGAARHIDCRMVDRKPVAAMREDEHLAVEAGETIDAADQDHVVAPVMLGLAPAFELRRDALDEGRAARAGLAIPRPGICRRSSARNGSRAPPDPPRAR